MVRKRNVVSSDPRRRSPRLAKRRSRFAREKRQGVHLLPLIGGLAPTLKRAQLRIAELILKDPEQFINHPIAELAEHAGVSTGAIIQFCKSLNLKGLPALKLALARELVQPELAFPEGGNERDGSPSITHRVFREHVKSLHETLQLNDERSFDAAVGALSKARRIVLFSIGLSYPIAYSLYARLRFIGFPAFIEYDSHMQLVAAAEMCKHDVAIAFSVSGSTRETVECLRVSRARKAKTICITNSVDSPLAQAADITLYAAPSKVKYSQAPLASRVSQLALADALLVILYRDRKRGALAHLARAEENLLNRRIG
jgi:DNA-binding MurR/RpiR family transcriptional regulator